MTSPSILQIVSGFKPNMDGVGDFARILGGVLWQDHGLRSHFLVYRKPKQLIDPQEIAPCSISYSPEPTPEACAEALEAALKGNTFQCALLHYVPYGYSSQGVPGSFAQMMARFSEKLDIHIFFHETWAEGPPWKRAFWTKRDQVKSLKLLMQTCKSSFTSTELYRNRLQSTSPASPKPTRVRIFSNMGEPVTVTPVIERERRLVIFGQLVTRLRIYRKQAVLDELCRKLQITSVADVGAGMDSAIPHAIAGMEVQRLGRLDEQEVSHLLSSSLAGAVEYSPEYWAKSGVIAAYAAHGIVPVFFSERGKLSIEREVPFIDVRDLLAQSKDGAPIPDSVLKGVADRSHQLYLERQSVARCAESVAMQVMR